MNRLLLVFVGIFGLSGCIGTNVKRDVLVQPIQKLEIKPSATMEVFVPVGDVLVLGVKDGDFRATAEIYCAQGDSKCARKASEVEFATTIVNDRTIIQIEPKRALKYRKTSPRFSFYVPKVENLSVFMGPGDLTVDGVQACLEVDMDAGDLDIKQSAQAVGRVFLDANFGDVSLVTPTGAIDGKRKLLVGAEVDWKEGSGKCLLRADLQAGDIRAELTP